ncbi:uncharacterized protein OCT59_013768 [Rhizophagus irregularis]|uniref:MIR domain-containing protein n=1 Tax=Rhizophagus irregularis (strain DAOM 197198w) TaxID=1432141 RepID=A0A015L8G7_RHIIW|nr:hypothetical protein RirG_037040 [Rhizophagus irregularis DAOM 197198w]UZO21372.1 hypothetical protein OCT59_013768 [Rhizophagus irregularis]GET59060.1 hypothetical protein GLOIN_2v1598969 [Rhizophagus irregularis DAOM 181602=DAOM 197198]
MDPPKYNGTMHPEEWIQQFKASYYYNNTSGNEVYLCKQLIHPAIKIPSIENISTYNELLNALKAHVSFAIFKESCKKKLLELTYIPEKDGGDTAAFLSKFQTLCYNAGINNIEEIKIIIYKIIIKMSNEFFKSEFIRKSKEINSIEELLKLFNDITADEAISVKKGSYVAIKHAATGKYLSSVSNLNYENYETGSGNQAVFAGKTSLELNAIWNIFDNKNRSNVFYDDIYFVHQPTGRRLICTSYKSLSNYSEVSCYMNYGDYYEIWKLKQYNSTNNCAYVKSQDRIILQNNYLKKILRSHELEFTINNEKFQEVVCHDERIGGNDEWIIELIDTHLFQYLCDISKYIV